MDFSSCMENEPTVYWDVATGECVDFRVVWNKKSYSVSFPLDHKAIKLKEHIESLTGMEYVLM